MKNGNIYLFKAMKMEGVNEAVAASSGAAVSSGKAMAIGGFVGAGIISVISMLMLEPQSKKEKAICFLSTFICAFCVSSSIKLYYGIHFPDTWDGTLANTGLIMASGGPGWVLVSGFFRSADKLKGKDLGQIIHIVKGWFK